MIWQFRPTLLAISVMLLSGCATNLHSSAHEKIPKNLPQQWQQQVAKSALKVNEPWLEQLQTPALNNMVYQALKNNQQLLQTGYDVAITEQQLIATGAALWPSLDLSARTSRSKNNRPVSYNNASSAGLNLSYDVDLWGKLSDSKRQANLTYLAQKARFEQAKQLRQTDPVDTIQVAYR